MIAPLREYHNNNLPTLLTLSDLQDPDAAERSHDEHASWQEESDTETLDNDHNDHFCQPNPRDHLEFLLDSDDPETVEQIHMLRACFQQYSDIEGVDGRMFRLKLYPGLATELLP